EFIDKTLNLVTDDPVAICARDGIDARSCVEAYATQKVSVFYQPNNGIMGAVGRVTAALGGTKDSNPSNMLGAKTGANADNQKPNNFTPEQTKTLDQVDAR